MKLELRIYSRPSGLFVKSVYLELYKRVTKIHKEGFVFSASLIPACPCGRAGSRNPGGITGPLK